MVYVSPWERLSDARARLRDAVGRSQEEAQTDICRAIADGVVKIRGQLGKHTTKPLRAPDDVLDGTDFSIPAGLKPEDLDWDQSRPLRPWVVRRGKFHTPGHWELEWIEVSRDDVTNVLCRAALTRSESAPRASTKRRLTSKTQPARELALGVIRQLYPEDVPGQAAVPNKNLCRRVGEELKKMKMRNVSDETILRAAGRRT